jgi:hypothetical protein
MREEMVHDLEPIRPVHAAERHQEVKRQTGIVAQPLTEEANLRRWNNQRWIGTIRLCRNRCCAEACLDASDEIRRLHGGSESSPATS